MPQFTSERGFKASVRTAESEEQVPLCGDSVAHVDELKPHEWKMQAT
jgi:hypothetical protein